MGNSARDEGTYTLYHASSSCNRQRPTALRGQAKSLRLRATPKCTCKLLHHLKPEARLQTLTMCLQDHRRACAGCLCVLYDLHFLAKNVAIELSTCATASSVKLKHRPHPDSWLPWQEVFGSCSFVQPTLHKSSRNCKKFADYCLTPA